MHRCAVHYYSPKASFTDRSLYDRLRKTEVFKSKKISKSLRLIQSNHLHTKPGGEVTCYLKDVDNCLQIIVPKKPLHRQFCYTWQLPRRLMTYLQIKEPSAEAVLGGILNSESLVTVESILIDVGVMNVNGIPRPQMDEEKESEDDDDDDESVTTTSAAARSKITRERLHNYSSDDDTAINSSDEPVVELATGGWHRGETMGQLTVPLRPRRYSTPIPPTITDQTPNRPEISPYKILLDHLINCAATVPAALPKRGSASILSHNTPNLQEAKTVFPPGSLERNFKIGAAGELFVCTAHIDSANHLTSANRSSNFFETLGLKTSVSITGEAKCVTMLRLMSAMKRLCLGLTRRLPI